MASIPPTPSSPREGSPLPDGPSGSRAGIPAADEGALVDLALGALGSDEQLAVERRCQGEPTLGREAASLKRLTAAARGMAEEAPAAGLAQRIALRVRDQVAAEERTARVRSGAAEGRWSLRTRVRILLASVAVHVAVLGWIVLRDRPSPGPGEPPLFEVSVVSPVERIPAEPGEVFEPLELGSVVAADEVPDSLLVSVGLDPDAPATPNLRVVEYPQPVQLEMLARSRAGVRSQRLARTSPAFADTAQALARGLEALAARQLPDGSFPLDLTVPAERRPALAPCGVTALALLPFLAEGRRSMPAPGQAADPIVVRGLAWLRDAVGLRSAGDGSTSRPAQAALGADDLALAVIALSEDYMLSYGRLPPAEAAGRGRDLAALVERLASLQQSDGSFPGSGRAGGPLWPLLALDAARHTGVSLRGSQVSEGLARWYRTQPRTADGLPADGRGRPDPLLAAAEVLSSRLSLDAAHMRASSALLQGGEAPDASVGTLATALALYRVDAHGFTTWSRGASAALLARLGTAGVVLRGDPVVDTALVLLALQAAYRLY